jgi:hypothetical protein
MKSKGSSRLGHPAALRAFRELAGRSDADKWRVYLAVCERLRTAADGELGAMRDGLAACARDVGVAVPSVAQYARWQAAEGVARRRSRRSVEVRIVVEGAQHARRRAGGRSD